MNRKKGGAGVGKTKRGKGTKIMGLADAIDLRMAKVNPVGMPMPLA